MKTWTAIGTVAGAAATLFLVGCGGRAAKPVQQKQALDTQVGCQNLKNQKTFNEKRIADLRDERVENRKRSLARVPGAIIGNPISAIALADTSRAVYIEIDALENRNKEIDRLFTERDCATALAPKAKPVPVAAEPIDDSEIDYDPLVGTKPPSPEASTEAGATDSAGAGTGVSAETGTDQPPAAAPSAAETAADTAQAADGAYGGLGTATPAAE